MGPNICDLCGQESETTQHIMSSCIYTKNIRAKVAIDVPFSIDLPAQSNIWSRVGVGRDDRQNKRSNVADIRTCG